MVFATFDGNNSDQFKISRAFQAVKLLTPSMINNSGLQEVKRCD